MVKDTALKNILFDLGGVILDLDVPATLQGFYNLDFPSGLLQYPENFETDVFFRYETGVIDSEEFRNEIRRISGCTFSDEEFDRVWMAMLTGVSKRTVRLLKALSPRYDLYVLSNTCPLHIARFEQMFADAVGKTMGEVFVKAYYSYQTGYHKPDPAAFDHVIRDAGIDPRETLFLDDNIHNVKAAKEQGFHAIHISEYVQLEKVGFDL